MQGNVAEQKAAPAPPAPHGRCIVCKQAFGENADDRMEAVETDCTDFNKDPFHISCHEQWTTAKTAKCEVVQRILHRAGVDADVGWSSFRHHETKQLMLVVHANRKGGEIRFFWDGEKININARRIVDWLDRAFIYSSFRNEPTVTADNEETAVQFVRLLDLASRMMTNEELAQVLNQLDPSKPLGPELHTAGLRIFSTQVAVEAVALRQGAAGIEVLMRKRTADEPSYVGQYHCPGSFVRSGEQTADVLKRLTERESLGEVVAWQLVDSVNIDEERGWYCANIYLVEVKDIPEGATWFPVDHLPEPTIDHHANILIPMAVAHFRKQ